MTSRLPSLLLGACCSTLQFSACDQRPVDLGPTESELHWHTIDTFPRSTWISDVWGSSSNDVYVGYLARARALRHFDGSDWRWVSLPGAGHVWSVWSSGPNDVYAVLESPNTVLHFDGSEWSSIGLSARHVVGTGPQDVYLIDSQSVYRFTGAAWDTILTTSESSNRIAWALPNGYLVMRSSAYPGPDTLHTWNGSYWSGEPAPGTLSALWASAPDDLFAAGFDIEAQSGAIWHWNGAGWTPMSLPGEFGYINDIFGVNAGTVFATTCCGTFLKYNGASWTAEPLPTTHQLTDVWASSSADVYVAARDVVFHGDGVTWKSATPLQPNGVQAAWAESSDRLVVVGEGGMLYRYDRGIWTTESLGSFGLHSPVIVGSGWNDLYVSDWYDGVLHYDGTQWSLLTAEGANDIALSSDGYLFAVHYESISRFDGAGWTRVERANAAFQAVWAAAFDYAVIVGQSVWRLDGSGVKPVADYVAEDVWGLSRAEAYLVGREGIARFDGTRLEPLGPPNTPLRRITGTAPDHIIASSGYGTFFRRGELWSFAPGNPSEYLVDLVPAGDGSIVRVTIDGHTDDSAISYHRP